MPSTSAVPESGLFSPSSISMVVVLPAPFGTEQAEYFATAHLEGDSVNSLDIAVALAMTRSHDLNDRSACVVAGGHNRSVAGSHTNEPALPATVSATRGDTLWHRGGARLQAAGGLRRWR